VLVPGSGPIPLPEYDASLGQVVVDRVCGEAVIKGAHVFTPGVVATTSNIDVGDVVEVWADCERGEDGADRPRRLKGSIVGEGPPAACVYIGRGRAEMKKIDIVKSKKGLAVTLTDTAFDFPACNGLFLGNIAPDIHSSCTSA